MSNEANMPAFPSFDAEGRCGPTIGLTKREYFAAMAMQGVLANPTRCPSGPVDMDARAFALLTGRVALEFADALLAELAKGDK